MAIVISIVLLAIYFLPTLLGANRGVNHPVVLFLFNLFTGWSLLGWIVALLWAVTGQTRAADRFYRRADRRTGDEYLLVTAKSARRSPRLMANAVDSGGEWVRVRDAPGVPWRGDAT